MDEKNEVYPVQHHNVVLAMWCLESLQKNSTNFPHMQRLDIGSPLKHQGGTRTSDYIQIHSEPTPFILI